MSIDDLIITAITTEITNEDIAALNKRLSEYKTCTGHILANIISAQFLPQCANCKRFNPTDGEDIPPPLKHGYCIKFVNV